MGVSIYNHIAALKCIRTNSRRTDRKIADSPTRINVAG